MRNSSFLARTLRGGEEGGSQQWWDLEGGGNLGEGESEEVNRPG